MTINDYKLLFLEYNLKIYYSKIKYVPLRMQDWGEGSMKDFYADAK